MTLSNTHITIIAIALFFGLVIGAVWFTPRTSFGSVSVTDEYTATSTAASTVYGATITGSKVIRTGTGSLGSYVITGANTGVISFYDATTTDVNKRTGQKATSTILIANFPASAAAGTYVFDAVYSTGLYIDLASGAMATGTITYR